MNIKLRYGRLAHPKKEAYYTTKKNLFKHTRKQFFFKYSSMNHLKTCSWLVSKVSTKTCKTFKFQNAINILFFKKHDYFSVIF